MTIHAVATFNDGKTQEETLNFNLTEIGGIFSAPALTPEEMEEMMKHRNDNPDVVVSFEVNEEIAKIFNPDDIQHGIIED